MLADLRNFLPVSEGATTGHRFRRQKTHSQQNSVFTGTGKAVGEDSELSGDESNDYLVEVDYIDEIDFAIRQEIERKFRKSKVNASYVFPRSVRIEDTRKTPSPIRLHPIQAIVKKNQGHKASKSFLDEVLNSAAKRPSTTARKL